MDLQVSILELEYYHKLEIRHLLFSLWLNIVLSCSFSTVQIIYNDHVLPC